MKTKTTRQLTIKTRLWLESVAENDLALAWRKSCRQRLLCWLVLLPAFVAVAVIFIIKTLAL